MNNLHFNSKDNAALKLIRDAIASIKNETESRGLQSGDWQYAASVVQKSGVPMSRVERLVKMQMLSSRPSDGNGLLISCAR